MSRDYQHNYSELKPAVFNTDVRVRKAETMVRVIRDFVGSDDLSPYHLLDVGSSSGIIDNFLADFFGQVTGIDIDKPGLAHAREKFSKDNLSFEYGDAMQMGLTNDSVDAVACTQIYEHVPDASRMLEEIFRVLRPGGFCYFAATNRLSLMEPHYRLPFLSMVPRPLAHHYLRVAGKGDYYHEKLHTRRTLQRLCRDFEIIDYSEKIVADPRKYAVEYMLPPDSLKWRTALAITRFARWAAPMIWILRKPEGASAG